MHGWIFRVALIWGVLGFGPTAGSARGDEYHFAIVFGSQSHPKQLRYTHTWATFVRAVGTGPDLSTYAIETATISWLPASLIVRVWAKDPEPGVNFSMEDTIRYVQGNGETVTAWGPFQVMPFVYQRALGQIARLNSGQVQYRAISSGRDLSFTDCIHAVADVDPVFGRGHYPLLRVGKPASRYIARNIKERSLFDQSMAGHDWLVRRLNLPGWGVSVVPAPHTPGLLLPPLHGRETFVAEATSD